MPVELVSIDDLVSIQSVNNGVDSPVGAPELSSVSPPVSSMALPEFKSSQPIDIPGVARHIKRGKKIKDRKKNKAFSDDENDIQNDIQNNIQNDGENELNEPLFKMDDLNASNQQKPTNAQPQFSPFSFPLWRDSDEFESEKLWLSF